MNLPAEVIEKILTACGNDARKASEVIAKVNGIKMEMNAEENAMERLHVEWSNKKSKIAANMNAIQTRCEHWWTTCHGDPAGGRDSSTVCNICGKFL